MNSKVAGLMFAAIVTIGGAVFVFNTPAFSSLTKSFSSSNSSSSSGTTSTHSGFFPIPQIPQGHGLDLSGMQGSAPSSGNGEQSNNAEIISQGNTQASVPTDIPAGFTAKQISPSYHKVRISSVYAGFSNSAGSIRLSASFDGGGSINVSSWTLKGNFGSAIVPQAVNVYEATGVSYDSPIVLRSGDSVNMQSISGPLAVNFRLNKCLGYLPQLQQGTQGFSVSCPDINRGDILYMRGTCQDYISSLSGCHTIDTNPPPPAVQADDNCMTYAEKLNYLGCFNAHRADVDFLGNEVEAWNISNFLDPSHDQVYLFDSAGLLVDAYSY